MQQFSLRYIVIFATLVCAVCSVLVSSAAVVLKDRQDENKLLDRRSKVLNVAGLLESGEAVTGDEINRRFEESLDAKIVTLATGEYDSSVDPNTFDQRKAAGDPARSKVAPANPAKVRRIPTDALVYIKKDGSVIIPIEGQGLWSTLYGYLALAKDTRTVEGIIFYEHGETPGLGGEIENPRWKALWPGRKAYDEHWKPVISVTKGPAGTVESDPYHVDGLSGATLTSNGVTHLVQFWLGDGGFGPFLEKYRSEGGASE